VCESSAVLRLSSELAPATPSSRLKNGLLGSAITNYNKARDIDIMIAIDKRDLKEVNNILKEKQELLPKNLHAIKLTHKDLLENLIKKNKAIIDIVKNAIIIYGQDKYVEIMKNVASI